MRVSTALLFFLPFAPGHCFVSVGSDEIEGVLSGFKGAKIVELYTND